MNCAYFIRATNFNEFLNELSDDDLFMRNIPFATFDYINENNIHIYANTTYREDIDIEDQDYPDMDAFFGQDIPEQKSVDLNQ